MNKVTKPDGFNKRSQRPQTVWLNPKAPDCAPRGLGLEELVENVDHEMSRFVASAQGQTVPRRRSRRSCPTTPKLSNIPNIIGEVEAAKLFDAELRLWRAYYQRCRREFFVDQLVVFPAGTDRFLSLGAAVDPCPIYIAPLQPRRMRPPPRSPPLRFTG